MSLTPRQRDLLLFVEDYQAANHGVSPSFTDMGRGIGAKSAGHVFNLLQGLELGGYVTRAPRKARAITVLKPLPRNGVPLEHQVGEEGYAYRAILRRLGDIAEQKRMAIAESNRLALMRLEGAEAELGQLRDEIADRVHGRVYA
jgi:SOS-response transcriptional repressor LexA